MRAGVRNTPNIDPKEALRRATASLPPDYFVITMTILTVIGNDEAMTIPSDRSTDTIFHFIKSLESP